MLSSVFGSLQQTLIRGLVAISLILIQIGKINCDVGAVKGPLEITTNECHLTEPVYGYTFDFTILRSDFAHSAISNQGDTFEFNICGNITRTCDGRTDVAACMKRGTKEYVLGTQHQLNYKNGKMFFNFSNGSKCPSGKQFQLHVIIGCDYTLDKNQSQVTPYAVDDCSFYITLETPKACLPEPESVKSNTCSVKDPHSGYTYNLLPLSDSNYRTTDRNGSVFILNVCKPVLYGEGAMCPAGSSVCFVALKSDNYKKKFFNYGTVEANPIFENDQLMMRHQSDTKCNATHNYTSIISFYCDQRIEYGQPDFMGQRGCSYQFSWPTRLACNNIQPCSAIDPISGFRYDVNSLRNKPFNLKMNDTTYTLAVCSDPGAPCLEHAGACASINGQSTSLGNSNSNLRFNQTGSPYLLYESGATCQKTTTDDHGGTTSYWSTKIEFICAAMAKARGSGSGNGNGNDATGLDDVGPKIIENSNCQLLIHYRTELACQKQITCKAKGYGYAGDDDIAGGSIGYEMDLTPLISVTENYEAEIGSSISQSEVAKSAKFFLNVCRPLVPTFGLGCPGGSAACMAVMGATTTPEEEQSLGFPDISLTSINRTSAELKYLRGSPCPADKSTQLSSSIQFTCDMHAGRGKPILQSIIGKCHYQFAWATNVICQTHLCKFDATTCEIINDQLNESYNMQTAPFTNKGKIKIGEGANEFSIDICGPHRKAVTDYSQSTVKLFFSADGPCGLDGSVNVELRLICSPETERASSSSDGSQCNLIYTQRTPDICKFLGLSIPDMPSSSPSPIATTTRTATVTTETPTTTIKPDEQKHTPERTASIGAILAAILSVTFFVSCLGLLASSPDRRERIRRIFRGRSSAVRYSRVEANEEANLLLGQNGHFTDSDDDMLL